MQQFLYKIIEQKSIIMQEGQNQQIKSFKYIKQFCHQSYESICNAHQAFYKNLHVYQFDKQSILKSIVNLAKTHETILINLCIASENVNLLQIGKFGMKMHLQYIQVIKWIIKNLNFFVSQKQQNQSPIVVNQHILQKRQTVQRQDPNYYYRNKQNSLFAAKGIKDQINKIEKFVQDQKRNEKSEINTILSKRHLIQKIEPSENENIISEAISVFCHQSSIFSKLAKSKQQFFDNIYEDLDVKPYQKIKSQVQQAMKQKIKNANEKLFDTVDRYIMKKNQQEKYKIIRQSIETQVNLNKNDQEIHIMQDKKIAQKLKQLIIQLNFQRSRADNLQQLMRNKTNQYQQQLVRLRFIKNKQNQLQANKKSAKQLTSMQLINQQMKQQLKLAEQKQQHTSRLKKSMNLTKLIKQKKLKTNRCVQQQCEKSLKNIKYAEQYQSNQQIQRKQKLTPNSICNGQSQFLYIPKQKQINIFEKDCKFTYQQKDCKFTYQQKDCKFTYQQKEFIKSCLKLSSKTFQYKFKNLHQNNSLLTISNLKQTSSCKKQEEIHDKQNNLIKRCEQFTFRNCNHHKKNKRVNKKVQFQNQPQQFMTIEQCGKNSQIQINIQKEPKTDIRKLPEPFYKNNNFQLLNLNDQIYSKNKNRFNMMIKELKKKRSLKKLEDSKKNYNKASKYLSLIQPKIVLDLYLSDQNALQAQLQFNVSTSALIPERKNIKQPFNTSNQNQIQNLSNHQYSHKISQHILKQIYQIRKSSTNSNIFKQIHSIIKKPFSFLKETISQPQNNANIQIDIKQSEIIDFVKFVTNLHYNCSEKPCKHLKVFLLKLGIVLNQIL